MADIFLSYASADRERVQPLAEALEEQGYSVWWDTRIGVGTSFDREIERELDACSCVVVVWSHHSIDSDWVRAESQEGLDRGILIPVRIDDINPPLAFRRVQTADLIRNEGPELVSFLQAVEKTTAKKPQLNGVVEDISKPNTQSLKPSLPRASLAIAVALITIGVAGVPLNGPHCHGLFYVLEDVRDSVKYLSHLDAVPTGNVTKLEGEAAVRS